jgi:hypothetical protein
MTPHAVCHGDVTPADLLLYARVGMFVTYLPEGLDCHKVCKLCAVRWPREVEWYRGKFNGFDHSWLRLVKNPRLVLDVYPWCGVAPALLVAYGYHLNPWADLYVGDRQAVPVPADVRSN